MTRTRVAVYINTSGAVARIVPNAPTGLAAGTVTRTTIPISWTAATVPAGGSAVINYKVYKDGLFYASVTGTSTTVSNLSAGQSYQLEVSAVNSDGEGAHSTSISATTSSGGNVPGAPSALHLNGTSTGTTIPLAWTAGTPDATDATQGHRVYDVGTGQVVASTTTANNVTVSGLQPGRAYTFQVKDYNINGESAASNNFTTSTAAIKPNQVTGLAVTAGSVTTSQIGLTWANGTVPAGGGAITSYKVYQDGVFVRTVLA